MPEYILRLIAEGKNHSDALELRVNGDVPRKGDTFTLEKEYPACIITYRVTGVSPINIKTPKSPIPIYQSDVQIVSANPNYQSDVQVVSVNPVYKADTPVVSALREPGGFQRK